MGNNSMALGVVGNQGAFNYKASASLNDKGKLGFGLGVSYTIKTKDAETIKTKNESTRLNNLEEKYEKESKEINKRINDIEKKLDKILKRLK